MCVCVFALEDCVYKTVEMLESPRSHVAKSSLCVSLLPFPFPWPRRGHFIFFNCQVNTLAANMWPQKSHVHINIYIYILFLMRPKLLQEFVCISELHSGQKMEFMSSFFF